MPASPRVSSSSGARSKQPDALPKATDFSAPPPLPDGTLSAAAAFGGGPVVIPNDHFVRPKPATRMPWEMTFTERKVLSKDPRMVKQCNDEAQWAGTVVEGVWHDIRRFALATKDWIMSPDDLRNLLSHWGQTSVHLHARLCELLDPKATGKMNGLVLCKLMQLIVCGEKYRDMLARHCYDLFDKANGKLSVPLLMAANLADPLEAAAGKKKKKAGGGQQQTMKCGAAFRHVTAMRVLLNSISQASEDVVAFDEFAKVALEPENSYFVAACAPQVIEVMCSLCSPPQGELPLLSMRWLATTEPVAAIGDAMYDADIALLRELEAAGGEDAKPAKKKRGGGSSSPKRGGS